MSNLFDQASLAHQRELDQAFVAGEQHARRQHAAPLAVADVADRVKRGAELDQAYRDGFEACALYGTFLVAFILVWLFVCSKLGVHLVEWMAA